LALVLPHGALFRGGAEGHIRQYLIEDRNYLDAVIGLPSNIFFGTGIPTCIMVFKKCRENSDDILFIDASNEFEKVGKQNVLRKEHIDKIIDTYSNRKTIEKFSYVSNADELIENEYNLNIPRYVDTFEEEEHVDLEAVSSELKSLESEILETDKTISDFCDELNIKPPF
jgi:type I restriction enzyme M protein